MHASLNCIVRHENVMCDTKKCLVQGSQKPKMQNFQLFDRKELYEMN